MTTENFHGRVNVEIRQAVAYVSLARADKHNALDWDMFCGLVAAARSLRKNRNVRAVILSGDGPSFCSGLDVPSFGKAPSKGLRMFQQVRDASAVGKESSHVPLGRNGGTNRLPRHRDHGEAADAIRTDTADVQQVVRLVALDRVSLFRAVAILHAVNETALAAALTIGKHLRWQQRMQFDCFAGAAAAEDLGVSVALQQAVAG